jgi:hypothetical protein
MKHRLRLHPHHLQQQRIFRTTGAGTTTRTVNAVGVVIVAALGASGWGRRGGANRWALESTGGSLRWWLVLVLVLVLGLGLRLGLGLGL